MLKNKKIIFLVYTLNFRHDLTKTYDMSTQKNHLINSHLNDMIILSIQI